MPTGSLSNTYFGGRKREPAWKSEQGNPKGELLMVSINAQGLFITKYNAYLNSIICPVWLTIFLSNYNEYSSYLASDVDWEKNEAQKL